MQSLWQVWSDDSWISADARRQLDVVEPFDEWEEFALFAGHYCVVIAKTYPENTQMALGSPRGNGKLEIPVSNPRIDFREYSGTRGQRRFGSTMKLRNDLGEEFLANTFGLGTNSRLRSYDLYTKDIPLRDVKIHRTGPGSRMCHAITDLGEHGSLLVGGRASPSAALCDCWIFTKSTNEWQRIDDLPVPLYRHGMTRLGRSNLALLIGGKTGPSAIFGGCLVYQPGSGWVECNIIGPKHMPIFGSLLASHQEATRSPTDEGVQFHGVLVGGISPDGTVASQLLRWTLTLPENGNPTISFTALSTLKRDSSGEQILDSTNYPDNLISRFGASGFISPGGYLSIIGGIIANDIIPRDLDVLSIDVSDSNYKILSACHIAVNPRPLLIGVSTELTNNGQLVVMGGGATCFSMGTFWNPGCYTLEYNPKSPVLGSPTSSCDDRIWKHSKIIEVAEDIEHQPSISSLSTDKQAAIKADIPRLRVNTADEFLNLLKAGKPVIINNSTLGSCTQTWSSDYIVQQLGFDREVMNS